MGLFAGIFLASLYLLLLQVSLHCLAVHFVIACIKLSSVRGEKGGSGGERMIRIIKESWSFLSSEDMKNYRGAIITLKSLGKLKN